MADNEGEESTSGGNEWELAQTVSNQDREDAANPRGNEWEVVSLTASAYAAAPGPKGNESIHEEKGGAMSENDEAETSRALFMSGHFVFPPSQHENLPLSGSEQITRGEKEGEHFAEMSAHKEGKFEEKEEENWNIEGLGVTEEFPGIQLFNEKDNRRLPIHGSGFDEAAALHGLSVDEKEQNIYSTAEFSSLQSGKAIGGSVASDESTVVSSPAEPSDVVDSSSLTLPSPESGKGEEQDDSGLPCGAWWKRRVASLCAQAKETNAVWSIFVAAAVMGLVLIGQRWQQERWQILQQRWQLSISDEKSGRILTRLKDVIVGGSRRGACISATPAER